MNKSQNEIAEVPLVKAEFRRDQLHPQIDKRIIVLINGWPNVARQLLSSREPLTGKQDEAVNGLALAIGKVMREFKNEKVSR